MERIEQVCERRAIPIGKLVQNNGQIDGVPKNPRTWEQGDVERLAKSIEETPELLDARGLIVVPHGGKFVVIGGNMRLAACRHLKLKEMPCMVLPESTDAEKLKAIAIKDNGSFGAWDFEALKLDDWDPVMLEECGVELSLDMNEDVVERKKREFEERMKAGEISEEDEEYQEFLEKFKLKKTTDDCYTPEPIYEAVANYVANHYGIGREKFIRPFYPGGDYQNENYPNGCVVVDNPPFSILSEILKFYHKRNINFFLFAPTLTLFSSSSSFSCAIPLGATVTYENGANVNTSFLTSLEPGIRVRSCPELYSAITLANKTYLQSKRKELPKYNYDKHVITSTFISSLSRLGIDFIIPVAESRAIDRLDSQRESGASIYGKAYLVSERVFQLREKAEREKAEREKAERWELSPRELKIVEELGKQSTQTNTLTHETEIGPEE